MWHHLTSGHQLTTRCHHKLLANTPCSCWSCLLETEAKKQVEPLQLAKEPRELTLEEAEPVTEYTKNKMVPPLGTTEGVGARSHRYPAHPAKQIKEPPPPAA